MRCFIALDLVPSPGPALGEWLGALRAQRELSVPPAENLHLTLAFLGELDRAGVGRAQDAVAAAAPRMGGQWTVKWGATGAFPSFRQPRVLWLGLLHVESTVAAAALLRQELAARHLAVEERPFRPHLTLARARKPPGSGSLKSIDAVLADLPSVPPSRATGVALYRSTPGRDGAVYTRLSATAL